jgi:AraC-like DNA-binding protein
MVCHRCKLAVETVLQQQGLRPLSVALGEVVLKEDLLTPNQYNQLSNELQKIGFEILDDKRQKIIEQIKTIIIEAVHHSKEQPKYNFSHLISEKLHHQYSYLSNLFSDVEGVTIEHYIIQQKIERVKELLIYNELTLGQIAFDMGYSSVAHLSAQFKKITGLTPSQFKGLRQKDRRPLDGINEIIQK